MTAEEAIKEIQFDALHRICVKEAYDMAISALEKQIPQKPELYDESGFEDTAKCQCGSWAIINHYGCKYKYCPECGQKLLWEK